MAKIVLSYEVDYNWGRVEDLYTYMRVCVCVNNGIVASFIVFGYVMHECRLVMIIVTCMPYWLGRVDFISKDEREMWRIVPWEFGILVVNRQVVVHAFAWLESHLFEEACFIDLCLVNGLYTKM